MVQRKGALPSAVLVPELRRALRHLYDPDVLGKSSLLDLLPVDAHARAASLRDLLISAVEALKPDRGVSLQSSAWRTYQTLSARYVQQFQQSEVAQALGLSLRQLRRQDLLAVHALAEYLWQRYGLRDKVTGPNPPPVPGDGTAPGTSSQEAELEWLRRTLANEPITVAEVVAEVVATVKPLANAFRTRLEPVVPENLPRLVAQLATLQQALLNVLTASIPYAADGVIRIGAQALAQQVSVSVLPMPCSGTAAAFPPDQSESLDMARRLAQLSGGALVVSGGGGDSPWQVELRLPAMEQATVLFVDDNVDTLQLCQRYLAGSRYAFVGARDPEQALALTEKLEPHAVVVDVMLPGTDGWRLLTRLHEHPKACCVPIIVCTILPQERLALALGAATFLRKPISRDALLAALDQQLGQGARSSP